MRGAERERVLAAALGSIGNAVMVTDAGGTIVWVNEAFTRMSGYPYEDAVGQSPRILKSGVHDERYYARLWSTILAGRRWRAEVTERHRDGHHYTVVQTITPVADESGPPTHFVAVHEDVTALRDSQARLRALFEHATDAIVLFDDVGAYVDANPAAAALIGYEPSDLEGMSLADVIAEDDLASFAEGYAEFLETGAQRRNYRLRPADGREVEVEFQAVANIVAGVHLAIARDVTDQRRTETELRFQAQLLDAVGEAVIATDLDGVVHYWNPAATRLYGWSADQAVGRPIMELNVTPESAAEAERIMSKLRAGETWTGEVLLRRRDGSTFPALVTDAPHRDASGTLIGIIGVSADIGELVDAREMSERRAAQQATVANLGRHALETDDLDSVGRRAEVAITGALGPDRWHADVVWDAATLREAVDSLPAHVTRVDIGDSGAVIVWDRENTDLQPHDREFLEAVANTLTVAHQRETVRAELQHLANHDPVTGLPNRVLFLDRLEHARAQAVRSRLGYTVLFLDLDGFKFINDGLGHDTGDDVLRAIAGRLRRAIRPSDTVARFGGDEFAILCEHIDDEATARAVATRIHHALREPVRLDGAELTVEASIGIVFGDDDTDPRLLLRDADAAMYRAKDDDTDGVVLFTPGMHHDARHRVEMAGGLRRALDHGEIAVHYQPIVSVETQQVVGAEALARWQHPDGRLISPAEFIPLAEDTGLIQPLGERILEIACHDARPWTESHPEFRLAVNLSPRQFSSGELADVVTGTLQQSGLAPTNLYLEITESGLLDSPHVPATMSALRRRGIRFAIDDFGTGHSSLTNLRRLPVHALKIDRSFVSGLTTDLQDHALVAAAVDLGRTFELTTVAEGIETPRQLEELAALGCDLGQGYLWSPPIDADAFATLLAASTADQHPPIDPRRPAWSEPLSDALRGGQGAASPAVKQHRSYEPTTRSRSSSRGNSATTSSRR